MSGIGNPKVDARGRSGPRKTNGAMQIAGQWVPRRFDMIASPAFRVLSLSAHRILARIEIEHCQHGGAENGKLPVTFNQFVKYGVHRQSVGPAIDEVDALGFAKRTHRGRAGIGEYRSANVFRLTYLPLRGVKPTDDWEAIETDEEAEEIARIARAAGGLRRSLRARPPAARVGDNRQDIDSGTENVPENVVHSSTENVLQLTPTSTETGIGEWRKPALGFKFGARA